MRSVTASRRRRTGLVGGVALGVVLADQLTKSWAQQHLASHPVHIVWTLRLKLVYNPGVAFSLGRGSTSVVTVVALAIVVGIAVVAWRTSGTGLGIALGLIIGGAVGNLVDRLLRHNSGQVIDFIDLRWWPVFNVADAAITCGVVLALVLGTMTDRAGPTRAGP